jgi:hypothetical protein
VKREERQWARSVFKRFHPSAPAGAFGPWLEYVQAIEVELHPGCRATLIHPEGLPVELRWHPTTLDVTSFAVSARPDEVLPWVEISMSWYVAALGLALAAVPNPTGNGGPAPASGKPASLGFYANIVAEYEALLRDGNATPTAELARRYGENRNTVKSWIRRGRRYLTANRAKPRKPAARRTG